MRVERALTDATEPDKRIHFQISLSPTEYAVLKAMAARQEIPRVEILRRAINQLLTPPG